MFLCDLTATVGRTPAVELRRLGRGLPGRIVAKLEMRNPCGSVKDRLGVALVDDAELRGVLRPGATLIDEIAVVTDDEAFECARQLRRKEGILAGVSSRAAVCAALAVAARPDSDGKTIVVLLPDTGERYITTALFRSDN